MRRPPPFLRPETTTRHRITREHLETYLALANEADPMADGVPEHLEKELRSYLKCGISAHGFARARCSSCGHGLPLPTTSSAPPPKSEGAKPQTPDTVPANLSTFPQQPQELVGSWESLSLKLFSLPSPAFPRGR